MNTFCYYGDIIYVVRDENFIDRIRYLHIHIEFMKIVTILNQIEDIIRI